MFNVNDSKRLKVIKEAAKSMHYTLLDDEEISLFCITLIYMRFRFDEQIIKFLKDMLEAVISIHEEE